MLNQFNVKLVVNQENIEKKKTERHLILCPFTVEIVLKKKYLKLFAHVLAYRVLF